ncbi:hypothetical protein X975_02082, partial [Stegodyphus mimosarum]
MFSYALIHCCWHCILCQQYVFCEYIVQMPTKNSHDQALMLYTFYYHLWF